MRSSNLLSLLFSLNLLETLCSGARSSIGFNPTTITVMASLLALLLGTSRLWTFDIWSKPLGLLNASWRLRTLRTPERKNRSQWSTPASPFPLQRHQDARLCGPLQSTAKQNYKEERRRYKVALRAQLCTRLVKALNAALKRKWVDFGVIFGELAAGAGAVPTSASVQVRSRVCWLPSAAYLVRNSL